MQEEPLTSKSLKSSFWVMLVATICLHGVGKSSWGWGFLIGSAISLFSLLSLQILIPMLVNADAPRNASTRIGLVLWMKLPVYGGGLYLGTHLAGVSPAAMAIGIGLAPAVITSRAVCSLFAKPEAERVVAQTPAQGRAAHVEMIREGV